MFIIITTIIYISIFAAICLYIKNMKFIECLKSMLSADGNISSKRVIGVVGYIVILILFIYATITKTCLPN